MVQPYCYLAAALLFFSYIIGLLFTLRTHAAMIWNSELDEKKPQMADSQILPPNPLPHSHIRLGRQQGSTESDRGDVRDSPLYKKILGQSLRQVGLAPHNEEAAYQNALADAPKSGLNNTAHMVPPKSSGNDSVRSSIHIPGFSEQENHNLVHQVAEVAATAATIAAQNTTRSIRKTSVGPHGRPHATLSNRPSYIPAAQVPGADAHEAQADAHASGGHDAPNWSKTKSAIILLGATLLYALIAEILVNTVDVILDGFNIDEKFVGMTLFALVPNTTEFLVS